MEPPATGQDSAGTKEPRAPGPGRDLRAVSRSRLFLVRKLLYEGGSPRPYNSPIEGAQLRDFIPFADLRARLRGHVQRALRPAGTLRPRVPPLCLLVSPPLPEPPARQPPPCSLSLWTLSVRGARAVWPCVRCLSCSIMQLGVPHVLAGVSGPDTFRHCHSPLGRETTFRWSDAHAQLAVCPPGVHPDRSAASQ